ncbi:unnamed protein product [Callosobruchus maculatus]|uniref:IGFBP N-terminal domain-containing protein n=1 Tax=Callosobruchus maculatus TaxID=64391 RepID=A0A653BXH2_CALMS|nr:unnamed protein product [Callosobruchus maculatus]
MKVSVAAFVTVVVVMALTVEESQAVCPPHVCDNAVCQCIVSCGKHQKLFPNGGVCGCCPGCVNILQEGDNCSPLDGAAVQPFCDEGLICNSQYICVKI